MDVASKAWVMDHTAASKTFKDSSVPKYRLLTAITPITTIITLDISIGFLNICYLGWFRRWAWEPVLWLLRKEVLSCVFNKEISHRFGCRLWMLWACLELQWGRCMLLWDGIVNVQKIKEIEGIVFLRLLHLIAITWELALNGILIV